MKARKLVSGLGRVAALLASGFLLVSAARAKDAVQSDEIRVTAGVNSVLDTHSHGHVRVEYHFDRDLFYNIKPFLTAGYNGDGSFHLGAGLGYTQQFAEHFRFTLASGPVYYNRNGGLDLGSELEFLSYAEVAAEVHPGVWLGVNFGHMSNASTGRINPGTEILGISCSFGAHR